MITPDERRGAELDFLKRHGREYLQLASDADHVAFSKRYPCYQRLVDSEHLIKYYFKTLRLFFR